MLFDWFIVLIGKVKWEGLHKLLTGKRYSLTMGDWFKIRDSLAKGYFIILTRRKTHLSTYATGFAHFFLTGRWGHYSHALVNVEGDRASYGFPDFKFIEAIGKGVQFSEWSKVFDCDSVCILKPKYYTIEEFDAAVGSVYQDIGKKYDERFKVNDDLEMSCVEIARKRMKSLPEYAERMRIFEYMIANEKNLTPQMFRDCPDFEIILEIKK